MTDDKQERAVRAVLDALAPLVSPAGIVALHVTLLVRMGEDTVAPCQAHLAAGAEWVPLLGYVMQNVSGEPGEGTSYAIPVPAKN